MGALRVGQTVRHPALAGTWSVWSMAGETPGGYFVVPHDAAARRQGIKYAVIRAVRNRNAATPLLFLIRTDPPRPDLTEHQEKT